MLTGQRRSEIGGLKKTYFSHNQQTISLPGEVTKNHRDHCFPIGILACALLQPDLTSEYYFPSRCDPDRSFNGWSKCKRELDTISGVTGWVLHDLRRTFRTGLAGLKVQPHIAERLVNHVSARTEMEETYDLHTYMPEMLEAMNKWEAFLRDLCFNNQTLPAVHAA
jgi:integrase